MSTLYLAPDPRTLADRLAENLDSQAKAGDFFTPATVVVPNRYLRKWLRLWLARRLDIAINLDFQDLEDALWKLLRQVDPDQSRTAPEPIDENVYRLMVLSILLEEKEPALAPLRRYLQLDEKSLSRLSCRRAWDLANRLGSLLRDYEYHRQDALIQPWLQNRFGLGSASEYHQMMERAQRAVFLHITREPDGRRALLNRLGESAFKTFPQYAMELMTRGSAPTAIARTVHLFGFSQVNALHAKTIAWLGQSFDVRFYHLNACAAEGGGLENELLRLWGRAGTESLGLVESTGFDVERLPAYEAPKKGKKKPASVLDRLHDQLLGKAAAKNRLAQDTSLQIFGCHGPAREVETVYNSILHNLNSDPTLRQTDIAVLVTDMPKYRAVLQAVFERPPHRLQYNMVDFNAAGLSMFGQALLGMLDLALESFSRSRVFQVILNPCFLARLKVDRVQAMTWLEWAESLGIHQGWDADEKEQQGYPHTPFYAWRLGLQRLRLGRFMDTSEDGATSQSRFGDVIPFADFASTEREHLDAFCRAVEGLLPTLARLRSSAMTGVRWARSLDRLVQEFLDVPADRPEEAQVRVELIACIEKLDAWDSLHTASRKSPGLPLALVREYVQSQLEVLEGNRGEYLIGGVTISALQPMRPVPFEIIYVIGMGEALFPGSNALSSFDLRGAARLPGDVRPAEARQYDFLESVVAAQQKLYLLYDNYDLQKDRPLLPAVPLLQLQRYLGQNVLQCEFQFVEMPAQADDARYLDPAKQPTHQDLLVQPADTDRCLALLAARRTNRLEFDAAQDAEWASRWAAFQIDFAIPPSAASTPAKSVNVTLSDLKRFLQLPAQESLRRHLRVEEQDERALDDEEPLVTTQQIAGALVRQTIQQLVLSTAQTGVQQAVAGWQDRFINTYADGRLCSRVPDDAFGAIDQAALLSDLQERIHGQGQIETFLREQAGQTFCGPVLLGESLTPLGAKMRFPALTLRAGHELPADAPHEVRLLGSMPFAWHSPGRFEILIVTNSKQIDGKEIHPSMIEPALFHLALLASAEPNADGMAAQRWLAQREFRLHVSHQAGIQTWTYPANSITTAEALSYLASLTRDLLDPQQIDLLPFDLVAKHKELKAAMHDEFATQITPDVFVAMLEDEVADVRENPFSMFPIPPLVEMVHAQVPADALAKVQRRFRLLDRGPASIRQRPKVFKPKRPAKS
jgi:exodeoxyribonuclease V gamma subunit